MPTQSKPRMGVSGGGASGMKTPVPPGDNKMLDFVRNNPEVLLVFFYFLFFV